MTITVRSARRRHSDGVAAHIYALPNVRELPPQPADPAGELTW
jgi:hypothetical protein